MLQNNEIFLFNFFFLGAVCVRIKPFFNTGWRRSTNRCICLVPEVGTAQDFENVPSTCTLLVLTTGEKPAKLPQGFYGCIYAKVLTPVRSWWNCTSSRSRGQGAREVGRALGQPPLQQLLYPMGLHPQLPKPQHTLNKHPRTCRTTATRQAWGSKLNFCHPEQLPSSYRSPWCHEAFLRKQRFLSSCSNIPVAIWLFAKSPGTWGTTDSPASGTAPTAMLLLLLSLLGLKIKSS